MRLLVGFIGREPLRMAALQNGSSSEWRANTETNRNFKIPVLNHAQYDIREGFIFIKTKQNNYGLNIQSRVREEDLICNHINLHSSVDVVLNPYLSISPVYKQKRC